MCGCLSSTPYWGCGPQPRYVPCLGIKPATLRFVGRLSYTSRATPELCHRCKLKLCTHQTVSPHFPFLQSLIIIVLPSVLLYLTILDASYGGNHPTSVLFVQLIPTSLMPWRNIHAVLCINFISFWDWIIFQHIYIPHFGFPFILWWTFGLLPPFGYGEKWCYEYNYR